MGWIILFVALINFFLALFVAIKIPWWNILKNYFISFATITSLWLCGNVFLAFYHSYFWFQIAYAFGALMTSSALILTSSFSMQKKLPVRNYMIVHGIGLTFFILCFIDNVFFYRQPELDLQTVYTSWFNIYSAYLFSALLYMLYKMFVCTRKFTGFERIQAKYIFLGILYFGLFSFLVSFLLPMLGYSQFIILDTCGSLFFVGLTAYAIVRYHLMGIDIVIKRSTVYTLMILFVTGMYISLVLILENILRGYIGYYSLVTRILAGFIIATTFMPLRNQLEKIVDHVFFHHKLEYFQSLHNLSYRLITILDLRELMGTIVENISYILKVNEICLLFQDESNAGYQVKASVGFDPSIRNMHFSNRNKLIQFMKNTKQIISRRKLMHRTEKEVSSEVLKEMYKLKAELLIPLFFNKQMIGILSLGEKKSGDIYSREDVNLLESIGNQASIAFANAISYDNLKKTYLGTIEAFIKTIETKDAYTKGHSDRVVRIAVMIAIEMNMAREEIELLKYAGLLHDIGKIAIDSNILNKPTALNEKEFEEIKKHPVIGKEIVSQVKFLEDVATIILHHHEWWDGTGYPNKFAKEDIPLLSRILCVADSFDAMTSDRPYRPKRSYEEAIEEIKSYMGSQFDPEVVHSFVRIFNKEKLD